MKTLKELIAEGLPVGAILKHSNVIMIVQVIKINKSNVQVWDFDMQTFFDVPTNWQYEPTTAYDSRIDPETLPIPEPFWTGWVVVDRMKDWVRFPVLRYHYSGDLMTEIECSDKMNSKLSPTDCQPCLPPA